MKNSTGNGGFARFMSGRGFYAALALCLVGAVAAAWITVDRTIGSINEEKDVPIEETAEDEYTPGESVFDSEDVDEPKDDVKVEEEPAAEEPEEETIAPETNEDETFSLFNKEQKFSMPVSGNVVKNYSAGELVKFDSLNEWRTHDGIDIEAAVGTDVLAAGDGKVLRVWNDPLWGNCIEIEHDDGVTSIYCGLAAETPVAQGDEVEAGTVIGTVGETNLAEIGENSHLHFGMKKDGAYIDPAEKLGLK